MLLRGEQHPTPLSAASRKTKRYLGQANILVEGIDGSGKDEFVRMLSRVLKARFSYHPARPLAIVGQPAFRYDSTGKVRKLIERGTLCCSYGEAVELLTHNRQLHEVELRDYGGVVICLRGILTEQATLERLFNNRAPQTLGQSRVIDIAILIDVEPQEAYERICRRGLPLDWRETPKELSFFRDWYLEHTQFDFVRQFLVFNNSGTLADLADFAAYVADLLEAKWSCQ